MWDALDGTGKRMFCYHDEFAGFLKLLRRDHLQWARESLCSLYDGRVFVSHRIRQTNIPNRNTIAEHPIGLEQHHTIHLKTILNSPRQLPHIPIQRILPRPNPPAIHRQPNTITHPNPIHPMHHKISQPIPLPAKINGT